MIRVSTRKFREIVIDSALKGGLNGDEVAVNIGNLFLHALYNRRFSHPL